MDSTGIRWTGRRLLVIAVAAAAGAGLVSPTSARAADSAPYRAVVLEHGYDTAKVVTLSFDADWSDAGVASVLSTLKANGITAAFSLTGRFVERYPAATKSIMAAGSKLVNHSYDHPYFSKLTQAQRWAELDKAEGAYRTLGYSSGGWFRAPYRDGYADPAVNRDLALRGYYISFDWTFDTTGYAGASQATILNRVHSYMRPGAIIVMHPGEGSTDPANLPAVISTLRSMGYSFTNPFLTVTQGAIRGHYIGLGAQRSVLGAARTVEMTATASGGAVQWFQGGRMYWSSASGAHEAHGAIMSKYASLGTASSFLRFPTTDQVSSKDGVGRYNRFQGGSIYWTGASGAHEVNGAIAVKWASLGAELGFLRYPLTDELAVVGGRGQQFQGGNVYWSSATGAHEVNGAILTRYLALGGTGGRLGLPVSDEHAVTGGRQSDFQHGWIRWDATTGAVSVGYT